MNVGTIRLASQARQDKAPISSAEILSITKRLMAALEINTYVTEPLRPEPTLLESLDRVGLGIGPTDRSKESKLNQIKQLYNGYVDHIAKFWKYKPQVSGIDNLLTHRGEVATDCGEIVITFLRLLDHYKVISGNVTECLQAIAANEDGQVQERDKYGEKSKTRMLFNCHNLFDPTFKGRASMLKRPLFNGELFFVHYRIFIHEIGLYIDPTLNYIGQEPPQPIGCFKEIKSKNATRIFMPIGESIKKFQKIVQIADTFQIIRRGSKL